MQGWQVVHQGEVYVPLVLHRLCAGFPSPADDFVEERIDLNRLLIQNQPATVLFRVAGDSMIDRGIYPDDLVICDRSVTPAHDDIVVVDIDNERSLKVFAAEAGQAPRLEFGNKLYPRLNVPEHAEIAIVGVVMCSLRPMRLKLAGRRKGGR